MQRNHRPNVRCSLSNWRTTPRGTLKSAQDRIKAPSALTQGCTTACVLGTIARIRRTRVHRVSLRAGSGWSDRAASPTIRRVPDPDCCQQKPLPRVASGGVLWMGCCVSGKVLHFTRAWHPTCYQASPEQNPARTTRLQGLSDGSKQKNAGPQYADLPRPNRNRRCNRTAAVHAAGDPASRGTGSAVPVKPLFPAFLLLRIV